MVVAATLVAGTSPAIGADRGREYDGFDFVSRPDLHPPVVTIGTPAHDLDPGLTFLTPTPAAALEGGPSSPGQSGAMIVDDSGQPVWFAPPKQGLATALQVQQYLGNPVLTWWEGQPIVPPGIGRGHWVIADANYKIIAMVNGGNGLAADLHDFVITPQNTAVLCGQREIPRDLSGIGGPKDGKALEGVIQEVDIATGRMLFEWHSGDFVAPEESFEPVRNDPAVAYNYFHINSVVPDGDRNLLVSARNTHTVYQINRQTGAVNWRLGGKRSDFRVSPPAAFSWQHDARRQPDGTITLFDNAARPRDRSRAVTLRLDEVARTADLAREHGSPDAELSPNQGSNQPLANGDAFVGWGNKPRFSEFGPDGSLKFHASLQGRVSSYRAMRYPWAGRPAEPPAVVGRTASDTSVRVATSWNGDTEVRTWRVLAGPDPQHLAVVKEVPRTGFETQVMLDTREPYVQTQGLDGTGTVLGTSPAVLVTS